MDIVLLEDVYSLGRAGDVKSVANGYGRNYLIPQGLALPATRAVVQQAERIAEEANKKRNALNEELGTVAEQIEAVQLLFAARAGETGKLYGSVTTQMIAEELSKQIGEEIDKRQIHAQPLRLLGMHSVAVRLTLDLIPEFSVVIYREGENPENYMVAAEELAAEVEEFVEATEDEGPKAEAQFEEAELEAADEAEAMEEEPEEED